jgi:DNA-binding response OmpR family regulator
MKILIIEDEDKLAQALKKGLELEKHIVDTVNDGEQGYDLALYESYDVIILDLMLPKMTGEQICTNLRQQNKNTPIIMLTAKSTVEDKIEGLNLGADDYLAKPFNFDELVARINALARRPAAIKSSKLKCNEITMNLQTFEVFKNNKLIELSKKEFQLLEFLIKNKDIVLSKEKIINQVWEFEADILPNTVEVYVGYLRNKLGKNFIKTVRGFGYKIECLNQRE